MTIDKDFLLNALLCHNYLPTMRRGKEEIPPFFDTRNLTPEVARELGRQTYRNEQFTGYDQIEYKLTRFNSVGRILSIPHPLPHAKLCLLLQENWENLEYIVGNPNSQIKPQQYADGRVVIMNGYSDSVIKAGRRLNEAFGKHYRVNTDIANCFPSIYSHALPWALVGFEDAKAQKGPKHKKMWFNQLDKALRACKRDETQGIAIGPATSNIVAEVILARIDEQLRQQFCFVRYIDDYCCHCKTEEDAQNFVRQLEKEAAKFKLQLNIRKTEFSRLPEPVVDSWVVELGLHAPKDEQWSTLDAFRYLDFAVELEKRHPEGSVLKYAASVVTKANVSHFSDDFHILNYLLALAFHHPELLPVLSDIIERNYIHTFSGLLDLSDIGTKLTQILEENARQGRSDGMCWSLFHLGRLGEEISTDTAQKIIATKDALSILSLYWASTQHHQLILTFCSALDGEDLYELDRYWMLLYQLFFDGMIASPYPDEELTFTLLKQFGVSFLLPRENFVPAIDEFEETT